jgi:hypothetical protein
MWDLGEVQAFTSSARPGAQYLWALPEARNSMLQKTVLASSILPQRRGVGERSSDRRVIETGIELSRGSHQHCSSRVRCGRPRVFYDLQEASEQLIWWRSLERSLRFLLVPAEAPNTHRYVDFGKACP